jgi:CMP-N,N'-diacetyllegionaminic acid synthase
MIDGKRVLGLIPARGGSKGLPRKNVLPLAGKPLIAWTIEAARASRYLDRTVLSSDDDEIIRVAEEHGCEVPFHRPAHLAADDTPGIEPVLHALEQLEGFDYVVLLQPTSPLRTPTDIDAAIETCVSGQAPSCVSVVKADKPPHWMYRLDEGERLVPVLPEHERVANRQDATSVFVLNGAVYVAKVTVLQKTKRLVTAETVGYVMAPEHSVDIDSRIDLMMAEAVMGGSVVVGDDIGTPRLNQ